MPDFALLFFAFMTGLVALTVLHALIMLIVLLRYRRQPDPPPYELDDFDRSMQRWGNVRVYRRGQE
jgi:hypothetical protein